MKKAIPITAFMILSNLIVSPIAMADPSPVKIHFQCPSISDNNSDIHALINSGDRIAGYGTELIDGNSSINMPYFSYTVPTTADFPALLAANYYQNSGTSYNSKDGIVSCQYTSMNGSNPFAVSYKMTNGSGGVAIFQGQDRIDINLYVGLK